MSMAFQLQPLHQTPKPGGSMNHTPLTADVDKAADRVTDAIIGLSAVAVCMLTLAMYLTT